MNPKTKRLAKHAAVVGCVLAAIFACAWPVNHIIQVDQEFFINPDDTARVDLVYTIHYARMEQLRPKTIRVDQDTSAESEEVTPEPEKTEREKMTGWLEGLKKFIGNWTKDEEHELDQIGALAYTIDTAGKAVIRVTGYGRDFSKLFTAEAAKNYWFTYRKTVDGLIVTFGGPNTDTNADGRCFFEEFRPGNAIPDPEATIALMRQNITEQKWISEWLYTSTQTVRFNLPAKIVKINIMKKISDTQAEFSVEGKRIVQFLEKFKNDDAFARKVVDRRIDPMDYFRRFDDPEITEILTGVRAAGFPSVKTGPATTVLFDYEKEVEQAATRWTEFKKNFEKDFEAFAKKILATVEDR